MACLCLDPYMPACVWVVVMCTPAERTDKGAMVVSCKPRALPVSSEPEPRAGATQRLQRHVEEEEPSLPPTVPDSPVAYNGLKPTAARPPR